MRCASGMRRLGLADPLKLAQHQRETVARGDRRRTFEPQLKHGELRVRRN